ncbi:hypothetical protein AB7849_18760 [Rhodanobacter sp. 115]|uniref:hypothetical protein n=1 Tax=Rhodanobacter sp. FW021-MT20 TaxID=1162282 RepID=UPI000260FCF5|nr:hypothetical protein [Rhodanobacter sp. 115]EIL89193.1 hypothetical protein UU5_15955 [Rhodanobacter sp. 115]
MDATYLTTDELASRIHYDARTIRTQLKDAVLMEGIHYIRPFGGRKLLFLWEAIQRDIGKFSVGRVPRASGGHSRRETLSIPMANGGIAHG